MRPGSTVRLPRHNSSKKSKNLNCVLVSLLRLHSDAERLDSPRPKEVCWNSPIYHLPLVLPMIAGPVVDLFHFELSEVSRELGRV